MVTLRGASLSPFEHYSRIVSSAGPSFLFESGKGPLSTGRYSFFADAPYQTYTGKNRDWTLRTSDGKTKTGQEPFHKLAQIMQQSSIMRHCPAIPLTIFISPIWNSPSSTS